MNKKDTLILHRASDLTEKMQEFIDDIDKSRKPSKKSTYDFMMANDNVKEILEKNPKEINFGNLFPAMVVKKIRAIQKRSPDKTLREILDMIFGGLRDYD